MREDSSVIVIPDPLHAPSFAVSYGRGAALHALEAEGRRLVWETMELVVGDEMAWGVVDNRLPEPGDEDVISREWPSLVAVAREAGFTEIADPLYDEDNSVWVWFFTP